MTMQNITAWFFEGGTVGIPRRLMGLMEPLNLTFDDLGKIMYLLYCGTDSIKQSDRYAVESAQTLHRKGLIHWYTDTGAVDFSPMFDKISANLGNTAQAAVMTADSGFTTEDLNFAQLVKQLEQRLGCFLTMKDKQSLQEVAQRYSWSNRMLGEIYEVYYRNQRKYYEFRFFCQMAYGAGVQDSESLQRFLDGLNTTVYKTSEVLRALGKRNNPSEPQKELYLKWTVQWKFTHEMVLRAVKETVSADNPSFKYIDAILKDWQEKGIMSPEQLEKEKSNQQKDTETDRTIQMIMQNKNTKKVTGNRFRSEERDLSFLEK